MVNAAGVGGANAARAAHSRTSYALPRAPVAKNNIFRIAPLVAMFYSFLLFPPEVSVTINGLWLPTYRLVLAGALIFSFANIFRKGFQGFNASDLLVLLACSWIMLSFSMVYGLGTGMVRGAAVVLDIGGSYFLARTSISSFKDFRIFLMLCLPGLAFAGGVLMLESLSGQLILRPAAASLFGGVSSYSGGVADGQLVIRPETRLGLLRAYGPFSHPILAGVIFCQFWALYIYSGIRSWPRLVGIGFSFAGVFSLSSAAFLGYAMSGAAFAADFVKRRVLPQLTWPIILFFIGLFLLCAQIISQNGLASLVARFTLTPHTASYRLVIWEYGMKTVYEHPWFGIGYGQWQRLSWMGESIDAHFLLLAVRHGAIVPILVLAAVILAMARLGTVSRKLAPLDQRAAIGVNISLGTSLVAGQTVAFFGSSNLSFMAIVGVAVSLLNYSIQETAGGSRYGLRVPKRTPLAPA